MCNDKYKRYPSKPNIEFKQKNIPRWKAEQGSQFQIPYKTSYSKKNKNDTKSLCGCCQEIGVIKDRSYSASVLMDCPHCVEDLKCH